MHTAVRTSHESHRIADQNSETVLFERAELAIDFIQRAITNHQNIIISGGAAGKLCVFPDMGEYLDLLEDSDSFFSMSAKELQVEVVETKEVIKLTEVLKFGRDLDELIT